MRCVPPVLAPALAPVLAFAIVLFSWGRDRAGAPGLSWRAASLCLLVGGLGWAADPVWAQGAKPPAPEDAVRCLLVTDPLPIQYRTVLQAECIDVALSLCLERPGEIACIDRQIGAFRDLFWELRGALPVSIPPGGYEPRAYRNALRRADHAFAADRPCGMLSPLEQARCRYRDIAAGTLDLLLAARVAAVPISPQGQDRP